MSDSPFQSPVLEPTLPETDLLTNVLRVAKYQRWINWACLSYIGLYLANISVINPILVPMTAAVREGRGNPAMLLVLSIGVMVVTVLLLVFGMASTFLLAKQLGGTTIAVILTLLQLVPCVSLIVLLLISRKATSYLKEHHVKVGFMGASEEMVRQQLRASTEQQP
ncbi:hypothetical protein AB1L30_20050 [Bremerella sp. JC817]|uniref:hypothetical protein n=1 Tax=Bremerella sp. JC817 TaxID=3231756 RepID=UPI0034587559